MMTTSMSSPLRATATPAKNVNSHILPSSSSSSSSSPPSSILSTSQVHSKTYTFPYKLYDLMVDNTTSTGDASSQDVVSWSSDGKVFVINNHKRFASELLPKYFGHNTLRSFDRQIKYWSFETVHPPRGMNKITNESFGGKSWKHPFFEMGRRDLLKHIVRTELKSKPSKAIRNLKKGTMDCDNKNDGRNSSSSSSVSAVNVNVNVNTNAHANGYCINNNNAMNNDNNCLCYGEEKECKYLHAVEELRRKATAEEVEEKAAARTFNIQIPTVLASSPSMINQGIFSQLHSSSSLSVHTKIARELQTKLAIINEQLDIVSKKARDATTVTLQQKYKGLRASFDFSFLDATKQKLQQLQQQEKEEITVAHPLSVNTGTSKSSAKVQSLPQEAVVLINDDIVVGSASNCASQSQLQTMISQPNIVSQLHTKTNSSRKQSSFSTAASSQNEPNDDTYSAAANHLIDPPVSSERRLAETSFSHTTPSQQQQQQQQQRLSSKLALLSSATKKHPPVSSERRFVETSLSSSPPPNLSIRGRFKLHSHDVVLNWDKLNHSGNEWYRQLIEKDRSSTDDEKPAIAKAIVQAVHQRVPHGRFLKLLLPSNYWTVVPNEEAIDKTLQALHEPSPHQQVPSIRCNKRNKRSACDGDDGNNREAIDTNIPPMKKRCIYEVTVSSKEKQLPNPCPQEMTDIVDQQCGIGVENKISDYTFEERLTHLADYKKKHGDCNVPQRSKEYTSLGRWVNTQRDEYKKYKESKKSSMTKVRIRVLEELDFKWKVKLFITFEDRLTQLADYKKKYGDCNVPRDFEEYTTLGKWVSSQRTEYKRYKESKKSSMTKVRIRALEKLDFKWKLQLTFEERLTQLADYKQKNGDCNVPCTSKEYKSLGQWVSYQRTEYKRCKEGKKSFMTKVRIRALEKLGFKWHNTQSLEEIRPIPAGLSLLNDVAVVAVDEEQRIEHDGDDQLFGEKNTSSSSSSSSSSKNNINDNDDDDSDSNVLGANEVVAVAIPLPILELPPVETVVYVDDEQQIEHNDDDLLLGRSKTSSNNSEDGDGSDNRVGSYSCYRAEEGDRIDNNEDFDGDGNGGWRDLGDEYYDTDDEDCLVF